MSTKSGFPSNADDLTFSDSYGYGTVEKEERRELLLSSTNEGFEEDICGNTLLDDNMLKYTEGSSNIHSPGPSTKQSIALMVACIYIQFVEFGLVVAFGVVYVELIDAFNTPRADAALVQSVYMGTSLCGGVIFAKVFDRYNLGVCVVVASIIGTAAMVGSSFGTDIATLIVLDGVILGTVISCNVLATSVVVSRLFTTNRKFALAILTFGSTIGQMLIPFVTYTLNESYNWNGAMLVLSGMTVLNCIPCGLVITFVVKSVNVANIKDNKATSVSIFKDPLFYFYLFSYCIMLLFGPVEQLFSADLAVMKGHTFEEGSALLSVNGGAGLAGRLGGTVLIKIFKDTRPEIYLTSAFIGWAVSHYTIYIAPEYWIMVLCMVLRGLSAGLLASTIPAMQIELAGVANFAITVAVSNLVGGVGEILGGYIGGLTVDITGNYQLIFVLAAISALYCAFSYIIIYVVLLRRRQHASGIPYNAS